jgi:hypothetical protein
MTAYYLCTPDYSHNWAAVWRTGGVYPAKCSACRSYISERPGGGWEPLRVKIPPGKRHGDVYHYIYDLLVNEHAKQVLSEHVREGVSFVEAQIVYPAGVRLWSVEISNRCAMHLDCGVELVRVCPQCGYREYSTWDGGIRIGDCAHDIFRLTEDPSWVIVSEPLKQKLEAAKLKNLVFVDASTMHDEFAWMRPQRKRHSGSENH